MRSVPLMPAPAGLLAALAGLILLLSAAPAAAIFPGPPEIRQCQPAPGISGQTVFDAPIATWRVRIAIYGNGDQPDSESCTTLTIARRGHVALEDSYIGTMQDLPPRLWPDIAGNGAPGFAIARNTQTGAACCVHLEVFELGKHPQRLAMIPDEHAPAPWYSNVRLGAPDARGVPAVIVTDDIPLQACGGEALFCAKAKIILVWRGGAYRVAVERMRHAPPKPALLSRDSEAQQRQSIENLQNQAHSTIQRAVDLIFSGNAPSAWRYLQESCPQHAECRDVIIQLRQNLDRDPYYRAINTGGR